MFPFKKIVRPNYQERKQKERHAFKRKLDTYNTSGGKKPEQKKHKRYERDFKPWENEAGVGAQLLHYTLDLRPDLWIEEHVAPLDKLVALDCLDESLLSICSGVIATFFAQVSSGKHEGYVCAFLALLNIGLGMSFTLWSAWSNTTGRSGAISSLMRAPVILCKLVLLQQNQICYVSG